MARAKKNETPPIPPEQDPVHQPAADSTPIAPAEQEAPPAAPVQESAASPLPAAPQTDPDATCLPEDENAPPSQTDLEFEELMAGASSTIESGPKTAPSQTDSEPEASLAEAGDAAMQKPPPSQTDLEFEELMAGASSIIKSGKKSALSQTDLEIAELAGETQATESEEPAPKLKLPSLRGTHVVAIDEQRTVETNVDRLRSDLLDLVESMKGGRILTDTIHSIRPSRTDPDKCYAVLFHGDYKILIPALELVEEPQDYHGQPKGFILYKMLEKRQSAEIDYIVKGVNQARNVFGASRLEAMAKKRREYYFRTDRDGNYQIYSGICAEARVVAVIRAGIFVDLFGVECYIPLRELSYQRWYDASTHYQTGQRVLVKVLDVDRSDRNNPQVSASVKQVGENPYAKALKRYEVGCRYVGTVSMVDLTGVFVSLDEGVDCLCTYPKRGRPPRGSRVTVRVLGMDDETNRIWGVITHMSAVR